jgi:hypothetical protein
MSYSRSPAQDFEKKIFEILIVIRSKIAISILKMEAGHFPVSLKPTKVHSVIRYKNVTLIHKEAWLFLFTGERVQLVVLL